MEKVGEMSSKAPEEKTMEPKKDGSPSNNETNGSGKTSSSLGIPETKDARINDRSNSKRAASLAASASAAASENMQSNTNTKSENYTRVVSGSNGDGEAVVMDSVAVSLSMASSEVSFDSKEKFVDKPNHF